MRVFTAYANCLSSTRRNLLECPYFVYKYIVQLRAMHRLFFSNFYGIQNDAYKIIKILNAQKLPEKICSQSQHVRSHTKFYIFHDPNTLYIIQNCHVKTKTIFSTE